jgi:hypothetical protein
MLKHRALVALAVAATLLSGALAGLGACCLPMVAAEEHSCCSEEAGLLAARVSCCAPAPTPVAEKATSAPLPLLAGERIVAPDVLPPEPGLARSAPVRTAVIAPPPPLVLRI